ncbi:MAG: 3-oxo-tetronate kinase [Pseudomonadota bacterium]
MKIGVIADDFTGASDIALTLAEEGMATQLFVGVPTAPAPGAEAGVIALKSRTIAPDKAVAQSLAAAEALLEAGAEQIVFKICSTFDSTHVGNIGPVLDALAERLDAGPVIVCPAFPEAGRRVYMGHLFVGDRLLSETGMAKHPLTPMTDPDLRRVLSRQSAREVTHLPLGDAMQDRPSHVIADAIDEDGLRLLGRLSKSHPLICGGSGIALGLPANFGAKATRPSWSAVKGPGVVIAGSCSETTRAQVDVFEGPKRDIEAEDALEGRETPEALADWVMDQKDPLLYSSAHPEKVASVQARFGREKAAQAIENLFAETARLLTQRGVTRVVVAGGETSGAVTSALGLQHMQVGPRIAAGVPAMAADGLGLALKSGNFGGPEFFAEALSALEGQ